MPLLLGRPRLRDDLRRASGVERHHAEEGSATTDQRHHTGECAGGVGAHPQDESRGRRPRVCPKARQEAVIVLPHNHAVMEMSRTGARHWVRAAICIVSLMAASSALASNVRPSRGSRPAHARGSHSYRSQSHSRHPARPYSTRYRTSRTSARSTAGAHPRSGHSRATRSSPYRRRSHGHIKRSAAARQAFKREHPCPSTGRRSGVCPGFVIDHVRPLECGGADDPGNMQWQTTAAAKAKDKTERYCR
jgi:hypothetical protein